MHLWKEMYLHSSFARSFYRMVVGFSAERTSARALPEEMKLTAITCTCWALAKHTNTQLRSVDFVINFTTLSFLQAIQIVCKCT